MTSSTTTIRCKDVTKAASASLDGMLSAEQLVSLNAHLSDCPKCKQHHRSLRQLRSTLRSLPVRKAPLDLGTRLRVLASHDKVRRARMSSLRSYWNSFRADSRLFVHNLMRPFALPAAGGFTSAIVLFSMLSPAFASRAVSGRDVPTVLYTEASVITVKNIMPGYFMEDAVVVDVTVDSDGRMVDFAIQDSENLANSPALRKAIERNLLFTEFVPATAFGRTVNAKIRISFLNSRIDVKG